MQHNYVCKFLLGYLGQGRLKIIQSAVTIRGKTGEEFCRVLY